MCGGEGSGCRCFNSYLLAGLSIMMWNEYVLDKHFTLRESQVQARQHSQCTKALVQFLTHINMPGIKVLNSVQQGNIVKPWRRMQDQN